MAVPLQLPEEIAASVRAEVARGTAADEADFVTKAVETYRGLQARHQDLWGRVEESLAGCARGEVRPLATAATQAEARRLLSQSS